MPDDLKEGTDVFIVGQNPGQEEEREGKPFVGRTGQTMASVYLPKAGLSRESVSIGNIIRCRWKGGNDLPPVESTIIKEAIQKCWQYTRIPASTRLIVAQGAYALYGLTHEGGKKGRTLSDWRGWLLPQSPEKEINHTDVYTPSAKETPVLATMHLAGVAREPWLQPLAARDWRKVSQFLTGDWPRPRPKIRVDEPLPIWNGIVAYDTEYDHRTGEHHLTSVADGETVSVTSPEAWIQPLVEDGTRVVMQNATADWRYFLDQVPGHPTTHVDDTMYMHAVSWPDLPHDLNTLASLYSLHNRSKHLSETAPIIYSGMDAHVTREAYLAVLEELRADPPSLAVYQMYMQPFIRILGEASLTGIKVNQARVTEAKAYLEEQVTEAVAMGQAATGWPINLASHPQVSHWLYDILGVR